MTTLADLSRQVGNILAKDTARAAIILKVFFWSNGEIDKLQSRMLAGGDPVRYGEQLRCAQNQLVLDKAGNGDAERILAFIALREPKWR